MNSSVIHPLPLRIRAGADDIRKAGVHAHVEPFGALTQRSRDAQPVERQDAARIGRPPGDAGSGASTTIGKMPRR